MLRIAILGTGGISDAHIEAYLGNRERCEIAALVDLYPDKAREKAEKYKLNVPVYENHLELLKGRPCDAASVCLPPFAHAETVIDLLSTGTHVLVEKPMAPSLHECDRMIAAAQAAGRLLSVVAQNRFRTPVMRVKSLVDSGVIGRIVHIQVDSFWYRGASYYDLWWRGTWDKEGGGCTMNHAVHQIDLFQWMAGMPTEVQAMVANVAHDNSEVEDFSTAWCRLKEGGVGQITASLLHHGENQQVVIQGERAMISVPWRVQASHPRENGFPEENAALAAEIQARYEQLPEVKQSGHAGQIGNFLDAIEGHAPLMVDGATGRRTIELVTAIYYSATRGERVRLPLPSDNPFYTREGMLSFAPRFHAKTRSVENLEGEILVGASGDQKKG